VDREEGTMYIYFNTREAAEAACRGMNGESIDGSALHVRLVSPLPSHSSVGGTVATSATSTAEVKGEVHSIKLTNIPPSIDETSLLEKSHSLAGFSSLKLVQVESASTNYAWVNIRCSDAILAQRVLNGMVLDGHTVRASQPKPYSQKFTEQYKKEVEEEAQIRSSDLPRRFSFKLSDNVNTGLPTSVPTVQPGAMGMKNLPILPSDSQNLFQPVRCGLDLSSAHRSMLFTLPVTSSGHPVPLNTLQGESTKSTTEVSNVSTTLLGSRDTCVSPHCLPAAIPCPTQCKKHESKISPSRLVNVNTALRRELPREHYSKAKQLQEHSTQPLSLSQSETQRLTLSEASTIIDRETKRQSEKRGSANFTDPFVKIKRAKTVPAASPQLKSTRGPVSPSDRVGRRKSGVSETEENRVSAISQPSIRHTQTAPATSLSRSPTKDPVVSPSSREERGSLSKDDSGGSLSKDDSGGNPFQQALARRTSPLPQMQTPEVPPSPQQTHAKPPSPRPTLSRKKPQVSETVECSHLTSKRVLFSKHGRELEALREKYGVSLRGEEVEGVALSITGEMRSVQQARNKIIDLEKCVQASISCATFTMSCAFLPCLAGSDTVLSLQSVEKRNAVDFAVMGVNCQMSLTECSQSLKAKLAEIKGLVCLSQVQSFVDTRLGYFWKVRNTTTGEFIGLEEEINKKINIAYTEREPTCSFTYNSHVYVVDFSQMTLTDQTLEGQVHSLIKEPVWCRYVGDDFDYKPLQESISTIIESIFHQGASGFITIEGEQCVVDFHSTPMRAYSTTGEHSIIQRRPEVDPASLTPTVTLRVRGLAENLAPAEQNFRQILRDKITMEALKIPTKIQGKVTQLLLTTIARQYCVQCVYGEDQQVLKLSGTKENVSDVARLLLQETVKIMSESDVPRDHSVTPPHWVPQTSDVQLCPVEKGTSEWTHIEDLMKESLTSVRIKTIQRIQNKHLWQKYTFFRRVIQRRMDGRDINEKELFHGTRSNHPSMIYESEKGFDFRFGSSECLWGQGSYFAVRASYSDKGYAYHLSGGSKQLILASVVTGESKFMNKREKLSVPPLKSGSTKERYDTIRATTGGSEIYVVYDHEKAYPSYLITYRT
jgi:hypothetical protein